MSLSTSAQIDSLIGAATADPRHGLPRIHVRAASSTSPLLYAGWGGASSLPPLEAPIEEAPALGEDDIFAMFSATKLVTVVAVLQLVERGLVTLETDAREVLPELKAVKRLDGFDESGEPVLVENEAPITVKMLLTHTAGFTYEWDSPDGQQTRYRTLRGIKAQLDPESDRTAVTATPLDYEPGTRRKYGPSNDWAGFLVEHLSGLTLEGYFQQNIFEPLAIKDISFIHPKKHIGMAYRVEPHPAPATYVPGKEIRLSDQYYLGGGGLWGSAPSYLTFLRALLPTAPPTLLGADMRRRMFEPQLENDQQRADAGEACQYDLHPWAREAMPTPQEGLDWGFGGALAGVGLSSGRKEGALCWSGLAGTYWVIDPASDVVFLVWSNILPFGDQSTFDLWKQVEPLIYEGLPATDAA